MKLNTGKVAFSIEFDNGDKENVYFNPCDPYFAIRMREFKGRIMEKLKDINDIQLMPDGTPEEEEYIEKFKKVQTEFYKEIDVAFGGAVADVVFKHCSPFAIVDGRYFFEVFVDAITPEIQNKIKESQEKAEKNIQKHIGKYAK